MFSAIWPFFGYLTVFLANWLSWLFDCLLAIWLSFGSFGYLTGFSAIWLSSDYLTVFSALRLWFHCVFDYFSVIRLFHCLLDINFDYLLTWLSFRLFDCLLVIWQSFGYLTVFRSFRLIDYILTFGCLFGYLTALAIRLSFRLFDYFGYFTVIMAVWQALEWH